MGGIAPEEIIVGRSINGIIMAGALALVAISSSPVWSQEGVKAPGSPKPAARRASRKPVIRGPGGVGAASSPANLDAPSTYFSRTPGADDPTSLREESEPNVRPSLSSGGHVGMGIGF